MRISVFGGVALSIDGADPVEVTAPRPRLILSLLGARFGQVVEDDSLIEAIWGTDPPATARTALQTYISTLRDLLEPERPRRSDGTYIRREFGGYALRTDTDELDLACFDDLVERAQGIHHTDPAGAMRLLDEALSLWREPLFGELGDSGWALPAVTRWRERRAEVLESRFGLALEQGTEGTMLASMRGAVAEHPYRSRLVGQTALAHYRGGQQRRALRLLSDARCRFRDDLGLEPDRELELLEQAILRHDPTLRRRTSDTSLATPARLTVPLRLVGRDEDSIELLEAMAVERCVTIVGTSGVGKSSLAAEVATRWAAANSGLVHHLDLAELGGRDLMRRVADTVRVVDHPLVPLADSVVDSLAGSPSLLVLDTCEVDSEAAAGVVASLLDAPDLRVLATSVVPLGIAAEYVHHLQPLDLTNAVALLRRHWRDTPTGDEALALESIADRLDRLPLALELAAARIGGVGPIEVDKIIERDTALLLGSNDRPVRQRSLTAATRWSLDLLDDDQRCLLERLATHTAPFSAATVRHLWGFDPLDPDRVGILLSELVHRSLVSRVEGTPLRFRLLNTVRATVAQSSDPATTAQAQERIVEAITAAATASALGGDVDVDLRALGDEVFPVLGRLHANGDARQLALAGMLGSHFAEAGEMSAGREVLQRALDASEGVADPMWALAATQAAFLAWYQGDLRSTRRILADVSKVVRETGFELLRSAVAGCKAFVDGRYREATTALGEAADAAAGRTKLHLSLLHLAGNAALYAGDLDAAAARYRRQRHVAEDVADDFARAQALRFEAVVAAHRGDIESAWRWAEQSMAIVCRSTSPLGLAQSCAVSAVVALEAGDLDTALSHAVGALAVSHRHFDVFALRVCLPVIAAARLRHDAPERAARLLGWYEALLERTGQPAWPTLRHVLDSTDGSARARLGAVGYARTAAHGAAMSLSQLVSAEASV